MGYIKKTETYLSETPEEIKVLLDGFLLEINKFYNLKKEKEIFRYNERALLSLMVNGFIRLTNKHEEELVPLQEYSVYDGKKCVGRCDLLILNKEKAFILEAKRRLYSLRSLRKWYMNISNEDLSKELTNYISTEENKGQINKYCAPQKEYLNRKVVTKCFLFFECITKCQLSDYKAIIEKFKNSYSTGYFEAVYHPVNMDEVKEDNDKIKDILLVYGIYENLKT
ncbi:hypothetical protein ACFLRY_00910 [Bacteroidota bacterium]